LSRRRVGLVFGVWTVFMFLAAVLGVVLNVRLVGGSGTIYIRADGSIDPPTAPIQRDGDLYTFTDNIYESIVVERDNIVVDGAGYTVKGAGAAWSIGLNLVYRTNVTIKDTKVTEFFWGIQLYYSSKITLVNNNASNNWFAGIHLRYSSNCTLFGNNALSNANGIYIHSSTNNRVINNSIINNSDDGLRLEMYSNNNTLIRNSASKNEHGIGLYDSTNNTLTSSIATNNIVGITLWSQGNTITNNVISNNIWGIMLIQSRDHLIFHNNFINNSEQVDVDTYTLKNSWDNSYPSGGNYWSDYNDTDFYSGPYQNITGSDGIGDTPYVIDANNRDSYPFMNPWFPPQPAPREWNRTYGGAYDDFAYSVVQTSDGGYAIAGNTYSFGAGASDAWLIKTDAAGNMQWNKTYGGTDYEYVRSMVQTSDGGYALAGLTGYYAYSVWLVKTDSAGNMQWNKTYEGSSWVECVIQTGDGGYALVGTIYSGEYTGKWDFWLIKVDSSGNMIWNQVYGGAYEDDAYSMVQTSDGGYALAGWTDSYDVGWGYGDFWLVKTDSGGNLQWNKTYGGVNSDWAHSVIQTRDGCYAMAGGTFSVEGYPPNWDFLLVKAAPPEPIPVADFSFSPELPYVGEIVTFDASASYDRDGTIESYTWDFGDDNVTVVTEPIIMHVYSAPSIYTVNLTVTDNDGLSQSTTKSITVSEDSTSPITVHDYDGLWHISDFTITLTATDDMSGVAETYYKINNGPTKTVSVDGQPLITTEGTNNKLEYWSIDNAGNEELPHKILTGVKLDKTVPLIGVPSRTPPEGDVLPDQPAKVSVNATDILSGVKNVTLSYTINDGDTWTNITMNYNASTGLYETTIPGQPAGTLVKYKIIAYNNAENQASNDNAGEYYVYLVVPEFPSASILLLFMTLMLFAVVLMKRRFPVFGNY